MGRTGEQEEEEGLGEGGWRGEETADASRVTDVNKSGVEGADGVEEIAGPVREAVEVVAVEETDLMRMSEGKREKKIE